MKWHIGYIPQRTENRCSNKTWHSTVYSSIIHRSWKVTTTQMSISRWVDEQNVVCFYHGIPFSHKKQWSTSTWYRVNNPWEHAKWKKPLWKAIYYRYMKWPEQQICKDREQIHSRPPGFRWTDENIPGMRWWWRWHSLVNVLNVTNGTCYVNVTDGTMFKVKV